ncbi:MAG TPA: hypothetical protein PKH07_15240, partial [bacterium]|nr:hypothetical protein [bacterium]
GDYKIKGPDGGTLTATRTLSRDYYQNVSDLVDVNIQLDPVLDQPKPRSIFVEEKYDANVFELKEGGFISYSQFVTTRVEGGWGYLVWQFDNYRTAMPDLVNLVYTLTVKNRATGPSYWEGHWESPTGENGAIIGDNQIIPLVSGQPEPTPVQGRSCRRTFVADPKVYRPGQPMNVKLEFVTGAKVRTLSVTERIPEGWTYLSSSSTVAPVTGPFVLGRSITWPFGSPSQLDDISITYRVVPDAESVGVQIFSGVWAYQEETLSDYVDYFVTEGDQTITDGLTGLIPGLIDMTRDLPSTYTGNSTVDVSIAYDIAEASPPTQVTIIENIPKGWELVSAHPPVSASTTMSLRWNLGVDPIQRVVLDGSVFYTLRVPFGEFGEKAFNGSYTASTGAAPIGGLIYGDSRVQGDMGGCPLFVSEGGNVPGRIDAWELLSLFDRIRSGSEEGEMLFCFQRQWYQQEPVYNTPTPTQTEGVPTETPIPATVTPTETQVPSTFTPTDTSVPATATPTQTQVPATETPTDTSVPATATPTETSIPATATPSETSVPPTST